MTGKGTQFVAVGGTATWQITLEDEPVFVRVTRDDNGGCATMTLESGVTNADIVGSWKLLESFLNETRESTLEIIPSGDGGEVILNGKTYSYNFSEGIVTFTVYYPSIVDPKQAAVSEENADDGPWLISGEDSKVTIIFTKENGIIKGSGTYLLQLLDCNNEHWGEGGPLPITLERIE